MTDKRNYFYFLCVFTSFVNGRRLRILALRRAIRSLKTKVTPAGGPGAFLKCRSQIALPRYFPLSSAILPIEISSRIC